MKISSDMSPKKLVKELRKNIDFNFLEKNKTEILSIAKKRNGTYYSIIKGYLNEYPYDDEVCPELDVVVLSLVDSVRRNSFKKEWVDFEYEFFDGIDARKKDFDPNKWIYYNGHLKNDRKMYMGTLACTFSHFEIWKKYSESKFLLVLEDDAIGFDFSKKLLNKIVKSIPSDADIVFVNNRSSEKLYHSGWADSVDELFVSRDKVNELMSVYHHCIPETKSGKYTCNGTDGYILTHKGLQKLLKFINDKGLPPLTDGPGTSIDTLLSMLSSKISDVKGQPIGFPASIATNMGLLTERSYLNSYFTTIPVVDIGERYHEVSSEIYSLEFKKTLPERLRYASFVSNDQKMVYVETPKCACSTLKSIFLHLNNIPVKRIQVGRESTLDMSIHQRDIHPIKSLLDYSFSEQRALLTSDDVVRFTVVRNPYARVYSAWADKIRQREPGYALLEKKILNELKCKDKELSFKKFVSWLKKQNLSSGNIHWRTMSSLLFLDEINYSKIIKTESIVKDFQYILDKSKLDLSAKELLTNFRVNESLPSDWKSSYDDTTAQVVYELYQEDFNSFGYSKDSWNSLPSIDIDHHGNEYEKLKNACINAVRARNETIEYLIKERSLGVKTVKSKKVIVIGDSHAKAFVTEIVTKTTPKIEWESIAVEGATLSGLNNPNSKTQAMPVFHWALSQKQYDAVIFQLGEVDTGFVIHYRAQRDGIDIHTAAHKALENYQQLVSQASKKAPVIVTSTCLPTIQDGEVDGLVQNARKEVKTTLRERTDLTLWFNQQMKAWCEENKITFVDFDQHTLDENQLLKNEYLRRTTDHHYDLNAFSSLIKDFLVPSVRKIIW